MTAAVTDVRSVGVDAERHVLGALMLVGGRQPTDLALLSPGDFWRGAHRTIFEAILAVLDSGTAVDPSTVADELERRGRLADAGGALALAEMTAEVPSTANLPHYARKVAERARRRRVAEEANRLATQAADPTNDLDAVLYPAVEGLLDVARSGASDGIVTAADLADDLFALCEDGPDRGLECGWPSVDSLYRPTVGQLTVVTGVPSHGKSTWLDNYLVRMFSRHGWRAAWFTPERSPLHKHQARLLTAAKGVPFTRQHYTAEQLSNGVKWLDEHAVWIDVVPATVEAIMSAATLEKSRNGLDALVIDPWNWIEATKDRDEKLTEFIGRALTLLARFAERQQVHVFVVAHPTKMRQIEFTDAPSKYQVPRPYDISESANWANKAWWCLSVWRDHLAPALGEPGYSMERDPALVSVYVQKVRDDDQGRVGVSTLRFNTATRTYHELDRRF